MKNKLKIITVLCFILFNFVFALGQKRIIALGEYSSAVNRARGKIQTVPRRITATYEEYRDGIVINSRNLLYEVNSSNKIHYILKERKGDKFTEREKIEADNFVYVRENGSAWHLYRKDDLMTASSEAGSISTGCRQLTVEEDYLENFPVKLYEEIKIKTSENILKFTEQRDWINDDGMLLKIETVEGLFHPRIETSRSVFNYEYNPADLKIEAPIK